MAAGLNVQSSGVKVTCKRCNRSSPAEGFILDAIYGMMVCPSCIRERQSGGGVQVKGGRVGAASSVGVARLAVDKPVERRPAGWDSEDEYLEKAVRAKEKGVSSPLVRQIDHEHVKYTCPGCRYTFTYDLVRRVPARCPYCSGNIQKFKV